MSGASGGRRPSPADVAVAVAAGVGAVAGSYAVVGAAPAFVVATVEGALARLLPGVVVTLAITTLGSLGQALNLATAAVLTVLALGALAGGVRALAHRFLSTPMTDAPVAAVAATVGVTLAGWVAVAAVTGAPLASAGAGVGAGVVVGVAEIVGRSSARTAAGGAPNAGRRGVLGALAALLGLGGLAAAVGPSSRSAASRPTAAEPSGEAGRLLATAAERSLDVAGMDPLVSEEFYEVDVNAVDPDVARDDWSLAVTGAVEQELTLDYEDLTARPAREEFATLRCVGEQLNGHKMDNALWTVVDAEPILDEAGVGEECCVMLRAADGYYEEFPLAALREGTFAYRMNGRSLPRQHGSPVRALIPGHWGEINVKWVTEIEVLEQKAKGYWEKRGWHGTGPVETVAKLHAENRLDDGRVEVGGHAYAGTRGVERVEVSTDGGATWTEATLSEALPGRDVWRQWVHRYDPPASGHRVVVRAVDGTGTVQPKEERGAYPSGPTGWVSKQIRP